MHSKISNGYVYFRQHLSAYSVMGGKPPIHVVALTLPFQQFRKEVIIRTLGET